MIESTDNPFEETDNPFEENVTSSMATEPLKYSPNAIGRSNWNQQISDFENPSSNFKEIATESPKL